MDPSTLVSALLMVVIVLAVIGYLAFRPRMLRWGASASEAARSMSGDELIPGPILHTTRAISISACPEQVWPWLAQMGQGRGGFYSYDWLENLAGLDIHNTDRIVPELQNIKPGDLIPFWRGAGVDIVTVDPPCLLVLAGTLNKPAGRKAADAVGGTWVFQLEQPTAGKTRLVVRSRVASFPPAWPGAILMLLLEPLHFIMEQKMLRGIQARAEKDTRLMGSE